MPAKIDMINKRFGNLIVVNEMSERNGSGKIRYKCICDCGNVVIRLGDTLRRGESFSCGCSREKHCKSNSKIYRIWADMIQRCENAKNTNYKYYGAKGIEVCDEWHEFEKFDKWAMKNGYQNGLSIDRINPRGNYKPTNCRWATREQQDNNRTDTLFDVIDGEKMSLKQISKKYEVPYSRITFRYKKGFRGEELLIPKQQGNRLDGRKKKKRYYKNNVESVQTIKWLIHNTKMSQKEIAEKYGVNQTLISAIKRGVVHGDVEAKKPKDFK